MAVKMIFSIYDRKAEEFGPLICGPKREVFARDLADTVRQNSESPMATHRSDFDVYCVGTFDSENGTIVPCSDFLFSLADLFPDVGGADVARQS